MNVKTTGNSVSRSVSRCILMLVSESEMEKRQQELGQQAPKDEKSVVTTDRFIVALPSGERVCVQLFCELDRLIGAARERPVNAIVLDNRQSAAPASFSLSVAGRALPEILARVTSARRLVRNAILTVLPEGPSLAHHAYAVGSLQLGGVIVNPPSQLNLIETVCSIVRKPESGKTALCLAGGGIEGMFYELGVLRALDSFFENRSVIDFDIFSGISAGAVISACLANSITPTELGAALKGNNGRIDPVTRGMLFDPNFGEIGARLIGALGDVIRGEWFKTPLDAALRITPNALFSGDRLRWYLAKQFGLPGMTNDFHQLSKKLFIGATDQDTADHVTFGEPGLDDVPISHAVRASCAMTPYYPPEKIKGRFYIDGIFTRTVNIDTAVAHGANLVICIDPLTPVSMDQAGYVSARGGFFNTVQSIKSMIRTRFSEVIGRAEEAYPNVSVVVFSPTPRDLEKMSGTMMRFFYRTETEQMAYESTVERIKEDWAWLSADFSRHGFSMKEPTSPTR